MGEQVEIGWAFC